MIIKDVYVRDDLVREITYDEKENQAIIVLDVDSIYKYEYRRVSISKEDYLDTLEKFKKGKKK